MLKTTLIAAIMALAVGAPAAAQTDAQRTAEAKAALERAITVATARVPLEKITEGAPYSAETVNETTQVLADGNHIDRRITGRIYRDGAGRVRSEQDRADGTTMVSIVDPVAGVSYRLDPQQHIAWRTPTQTVTALMKREGADEESRAEAKRALAAAKAGLEPGAGSLQPAAGARGGGGGMIMRRGGAEPALEHKMIDGIPVDGSSRTETIAAGEIGNQLPITVVNEEWSSPDLKVLVMRRHSDPRTGESTFRLSNIVRAEPNPTLFTVPPEYEIRDTGIRREQK